LSGRGFDVSVIPPEQVATIEEYDTVILGSAVYMGHWLDPAKEFAGRFSGEPASRHVWLFSSGPVGDPSKKMVQKMGEDPLDVAEILATAKAEEHRVFAGKLDRKNLKGAQRASLLLFRGLEGDFRIWGEIKAWASGIADALSTPSPIPPHSPAYRRE
jgi:menaquinone-dependent protoporphyrinogen oxidase